MMLCAFLGTLQRLQGHACMPGNDSGLQLCVAILYSCLDPFRTATAVSCLASSRLHHPLHAAVLYQNHSSMKQPLHVLCKLSESSGWSVQVAVVAVFVATLFIRPTMPRNNLSDANKYAGMIFFSLINMFFDGACPLLQPC